MRVYEYEKIKYIPPMKVVKYLKQRGWQLRKEVEEVSVWTYKKKDSTFGIFLPLREDFADYKERILEILDILEKVEERPQEKILEALESTSRMARTIHREIIEMHLEFIDENKYEISIRKISLVLKSLQELFETIGYFKTDYRDMNKKDIKEQLEVSLLETFQGSFGLRLSFPELKYGQLGLVDESISQEVSEEFLELVKVSNADNVEVVKEKISRFSGKSLVKLKSFITNLATLEANLYLEWGSVNPEKGGAVEISFENIIRTLKVINKKETEEAITGLPV